MGWQQRRLTHVSAPAGFGKTTLVAEWLDNLQGDTEAENQNVYRTAWLSLDEGDYDPAGFLTYIIAALNQIEGLDASFGKGALGMLQSPQPPPTESILTPLIKEITSHPIRIIFVLDDYHLIDALNFFLENIPPQIHLVIATRDDPQLPLARLRARGQLTELRAADLRFTFSEGRQVH
jgi:LuxR family maltose regulon positive regulatory protein